MNCFCRACSYKRLSNVGDGSVLYSIQKLECLLRPFCEAEKVTAQSHKGVFTNLIFCDSASCAILRAQVKRALDRSVKKHPQTAYQLACRRCRPSSPDGVNSVTRREWIADCVTRPADSRKISRPTRFNSRSRLAVSLQIDPMTASRCNF